MLVNSINNRVPVVYLNENLNGKNEADAGFERHVNNFKDLAQLASGSRMGKKEANTKYISFHRRC